MRQIYLLPLFTFLFFSGVAMATGSDGASSCGNVTNLVVSSITTNSVNLNWDVVPGSVGYEYAVTTSATEPSSGTPTTNNFVIPVSSLSEQTVYHVYVRADCGSGVFGAWTTVTFTTPCTTIAVPYLENFESLTEPGVPACIIVQNVNGDDSTWVGFDKDNRTASSGTKSIRYEYNIQNAADDWFFIRGLNLTGGTSYRLQFKYKSSNVEYIEQLEVKYGTGADAASMTTGTLFTNTNINNGLNSPFLTGVVDFTPPSTGVYYIGFHCTSPANQAYLYVDDISVDVTGPCPAPYYLNIAVTGSNSALASFTSAGTNFIVEYGAPGFVPGTDANPGTGGTIVTGISSTVSLTGMTGGQVYDVYVRQLCGGTTYSANSTVATFLSNDEASGARLLTVGSGCTGATETNVGATKSTSEVYPSCSGSANSPVWYKFIAPASGAVRVSTDVGTGNTFTDSKLGLFSASDSSNYSTFSIISCDDDGGSEGAGFMSVLYATGLTPGVTYYVAVDKFSASIVDGSDGTFCIAVDELNSSMLAASTITCASNIASPFGSTPGYKGWIPLVDHMNSKLIALIKNPAGGIVQDYNVSMNVNGGPVRTDLVSGQHYLDRSFYLDSAGVSVVNQMQVQLFFQSSELASLQAADPAVTLGNLGVTRQTGTSCQGDFVAASGTNSYIAQSGSGSVGGASWVSFTTNGFSNFYIHSSRAFIPVKTFLQGAWPAIGVGPFYRHKDVSATWALALNTYALNQPYNGAPFNYAGTESVSPGFFTSSAVDTTNILDWVLVELRDAASPTTIIKQRAAFIREDGRIVDLNGKDSISFRGVATGNYFVVVRHRNHLPIRSSTTRSLDGALGSTAPALYDFSTSQSQAFQNTTVAMDTLFVGGAGLTPPTYGMRAGSVNYVTVPSNPLSHTQVRASGGEPLSDYLQLVNLGMGGNIGVNVGSNAAPVYNSADLNLDGIIRVSGGQNLSDYLMLVNFGLGGNIALIISQQL